MLSFFSSASRPSVCLLGRKGYLDLLPIFLIGLFLFLFLILSFMNCLYILQINSLLVASYANILFHSVSFLFSIVPLVQLRLQILAVVDCSYFVFRVGV